MRRREYYWSLFHRPAKNQLDDLRTDQIEAVYAAVPKARHGEYLIWKEGLSAWKPFGEFPDILISLRTAPQKHEPAPSPVVDSNSKNEDSQSPASRQQQTQTASKSSRVSVPDSASIRTSKTQEAHAPQTREANQKPHSTRKKVEENSVTREAAVADGKVIILSGNVGAADSTKDGGKMSRKSSSLSQSSSSGASGSSGSHPSTSAASGVQRGGAADPQAILDSIQKSTPGSEDTGLSHVSGANLQTSSDYVFAPKDVSKIGDVAITSDDDLSGVFLSLETTTHGEDRGNGRYTRRLPLRIIAGDIKFETNTIDVSSNGLKVEDMLPGNLPRYFNVELHTYKGVLSMVCSLVKIDGGLTNRLKIEINDFPEVLQALLIAG